MSVPSGKRKESKLEVLVKAKDLAVYTTKICMNKNIFLPEYEYVVTDHIVDYSIQIFTLCWTANNVMVKGDEEKLKYRQECQTKAILYCNNLLALIEFAHKLFHLKYKRIEYWSRKVIETRNLIRAWKKSDRDHFNAEQR